MDSYFHRNEIDEIKTKLSGFEIKRIDEKIKCLSDESKSRVYQNYYNRKVRVGKNLFLLLFLLYIVVLLFTIPCKFNKNNTDSNVLNISENNVLNSLGNKSILLTNKLCKQSIYQDSLGYFELIDKKDFLSLKIKTNILFLAQESSCDSSKLVKSNNTFTLLKKDSITLFYDSNKYFKAEFKDKAFQLSLQPNHVFIGAKERTSNLAFYLYSLVIFGIIIIFGAIIFYFRFVLFELSTNSHIYENEKYSKISNEIDKLVKIKKNDDATILDIAKGIIDIYKSDSSEQKQDKSTTTSQ